MGRKLVLTTLSLLAAATIAAGAGFSGDGAKNDSTAVTQSIKQLQDEFLNLEFGMFIHYNMATYKGVQWVEGYPSPADFNPGGKVDTDAWADAAKSAGMTYAVLTAKHVGGFCLWDSKHTTYDVMHPDCPYKQDLVAQFVESFTGRGLKVGLYYAWRHPGFKEKFKVLPPECDPATHDLKEQIEFQKKQIAELIEKYPDAFYIWNDALDPQIMPADEIMPFFRAARPGILASSNWWDWDRKGTLYADIAVKEMRQFPADNKLPGETCWCLENEWSWSEGTRPKSAEQIISLLRMVNSRNSNLLLNVGPNKQGKLMEDSVKVLEEVGKLRGFEPAGDRKGPHYDLPRPDLLRPCQCIPDNQRGEHNFYDSAAYEVYRSIHHQPELCSENDNSIEYAQDDVRPAIDFGLQYQGQEDHNTRRRHRY